MEDKPSKGRPPFIGNGRKALLGLPDDPWVEVLRASGITGKNEPYSFRTSCIHHLEGAGDGLSVIVLQEGETFFVALSHAELTARLDEGGATVDLKEYHVRAPAFGDRMADGTICAGLSPVTKKPFYVAPEDERIGMDFNAAAARARSKSMETGGNYRLPTVDELRIIFNNAATFTKGTPPFNNYWAACPESSNFAPAVHSSTGDYNEHYRGTFFCVRLVRD